MDEPIKVLDHGYVRFIEAWGHGDAGIDDYECGIIEAARQSTQGSFRGWDTEQRLLGYLHNNKPQHATPSEFAGMILEVNAPIFVIREWQRHRTLSITDDDFSGDWAFNEMSARYASLPNKDYTPEFSRLKPKDNEKNKQAMGINPYNDLLAKRWYDRLPDVFSYLEKVYNDALIAGIPKEVARIILPFGRYTQMRVTGYLRNWLSFVNLRSHPDAQLEIQEYSRAVETIVQSKFPRTYNLFSIRNENL